MFYQKLENLLCMVIYVTCIYRLEVYIICLIVYHKQILISQPLVPFLICSPQNLPSAMILPHDSECHMVHVGILGTACVRQCKFVNYILQTCIREIYTI